MISCIIESRVPFLISLFNFQGPIATLSRRQLKEYIILFSVCQYFFESFLRFFSIFFSFSFSWPFSLSLEVLTRRQLKEYITYSSVCQDFFESFSKLFSIDFSTSFRISAESLGIISYLFRFVNCFFNIFCGKFSVLYAQPCVKCFQHFTCSMFKVY